MPEVPPAILPELPPSRLRERAALFSLPDQHGNPFSLKDSVSTGCTLLVFVRGHWCPYCRRYLSKIQHQFSRLTALGAAIVAISPEDPQTSRRLASELGLTFPILSDREGQVIDTYGVRNTFSAVRTLLPHPAVFIIDGTGTITFRSIDRNYKKRTTLRTLLHEISLVTGRKIEPEPVAI